MTKSYYDGYRDDVISLILSSEAHSPNPAMIAVFRDAYAAYTRAYEGRANDADYANIEVILGDPVTYREGPCPQLERFVEIMVERFTDYVVTPLNRLPVVITGNGYYLTRDGSRVLINKVSASKNTFPLSVSEFLCQGSTERLFRGKLGFHGYDIWHASGFRTGVGENPKDIVGRWEPKVVSEAA